MGTWRNTVRQVPFSMWGGRVPKRHEGVECLPSPAGEGGPLAVDEASLPPHAYIIPQPDLKYSTTQYQLHWWLTQHRTPSHHTTHNSQNLYPSPKEPHATKNAVYLIYNSNPSLKRPHKASGVKRTQSFCGTFASFCCWRQKEVPPRHERERNDSQLKIFLSIQDF